MIRTPAREVAAARRDLTLIVVVIVGLARLLDGPLTWLVAGLLLAATLLGALQVLGQAEGPAAEHGVPIESLILPAVAAIGCLGAIDLVPIGIWLVPALAATAFLVDRTLRLEERIVARDRDRPRTTARRSSSSRCSSRSSGSPASGALVPGGLAGGLGQPVPPLALQDLVLLAAADALVAGLLGYRAAALRVTTLRDALWSARDVRDRDRDRGGGAPGDGDPAAHRPGAADARVLPLGRVQRRGPGASPRSALDLADRAARRARRRRRRLEPARPRLGSSRGRRLSRLDDAGLRWTLRSSLTGLKPARSGARVRLASLAQSRRTQSREGAAAALGVLHVAEARRRPEQAHPERPAEDRPTVGPAAAGARRGPRPA